MSPFPVNLILALLVGTLATGSQALGLSETGDSSSSSEVFWLGEKGSVRRVAEADYEALHIFCQPPQNISVFKFWSSSSVRLQIESDAFVHFQGRNASEVLESHRQHQSSWLPSPSVSTWQTRDLRLNPFTEACVGVLTKERYSVSSHAYRVNYWLVAMTAVGIGLFAAAPKLCRNVVFHYATGVGAGVLFSLLVLTYFVQRRFRASWMSWVLGVYSVSLYFLTSLWYNLRSYLVDNQAYLVGYLLLTGGISFAVCYRMGPVENPRTIDLIQWTLQLVALILIYLSSYHQAASLAVAVSVLTWSAVPDKMKSSARTWYRKRFFRPKVRLLTESEFMEQSRLETERQLEELRKYCSSPKCDAWKVASRLSSPTRFAEFVQGSPHLTQNEVMEYSHLEEDDDMTDDEDAGLRRRRSNDEDEESNGEAGGVGVGGRGGAVALLTDDEDEDEERT